jgi:hypothetical protein
MNFLRPEVTAALRRGQEVIAAACVGLFGLWLSWLGGYLLLPMGLLILALGVILARLGWRRMQFAQEVLAPGIIDVDEAQVGYMGPTEGGYLSLDELVELRLMTLQGRRMWRLKQADGQALLIPVEAEGAGRLFDAFATLPGMDTGALVAALAPAMGLGRSGPNLAETRVIWRRQSGPRLPRATS